MKSAKAIDLLQQIRDSHDYDEVCIDEDDVKALNIAINAIKRLECWKVQDVCRSCSRCFVNYNAASRDPRQGREVR